MEGKGHLQHLPWEQNRLDLIWIPAEHQLCLALSQAICRWLVDASQQLYKATSIIVPFL